MSSKPQKSTDIEVKNIYPVYLSDDAEFRQIAQLYEELAAILKIEDAKN